MLNLLAIALGGALGALLRYGLAALTMRLTGPGFPWGTLAVNVLGCFVIGCLAALVERAPWQPAWRSFVFVGVLGAFTTFSTYGLESLALFRDGQVRLGLMNIAASNVLGLLAVFLGFVLVRALIASAAAR